MLKLLRFVVALVMVALMSVMLNNAVANAAPNGQSSLPADVLNKEWTLQYFNTNDKAAGQDVSSSHITIKFEAGGELNGSGGCNNYFGSYTVAGDQLTIADTFGKTQMACEGSVTRREDLFLGTLPTVNSYALNQGKLELTYSDGQNTMTFISGADQGGTSALPAQVIQTAWTLSNFNGSAEAGPDVAGAGITIKFEADGTLDGFSACNNYFGSYTVSGQQITIGDNIGGTRMACPAAATALESRYLKLLPTVKSYTATATELQLVYGDDGAALVYVSGSGAPAPAAPPVASVGGTGMPNTGGGTPLLTLILLLSSLVALVGGFALRKVYTGKR